MTFQTAARFSDADLSQIFTMGQKPEGVGFRALEGGLQNLYGVVHLWNASPDEVEGLVVYLRSLTPRGQGDIMLPMGLVMPDIDFDLLPESCNPSGPAYNPALCLLELPPICNPTLPEFDQDACRMEIGAEPSN